MLLALALQNARKYYPYMKNLLLLIVMCLVSGISIAGINISGYHFNPTGRNAIYLHRDNEDKLRRFVEGDRVDKGIKFSKIVDNCIIFDIHGQERQEKVCTDGKLFVDPNKHYMDVTSPTIQYLAQEYVELSNKGVLILGEDIVFTTTKSIKVFEAEKGEVLTAIWSLLSSDFSLNKHSESYYVLSKANTKPFHKYRKYLEKFSPETDKNTKETWRVNLIEASFKAFTTQVNDISNVNIVYSLNRDRRVTVISSNHDRLSAKGVLELYLLVCDVLGLEIEFKNGGVTVVDNL